MTDESLESLMAESPEAAAMVRGALGEMTPDDLELARVIANLAVDAC